MIVRKPPKGTHLPWVLTMCTGRQYKMRGGKDRRTPPKWSFLDFHQAVCCEALFLNESHMWARRHVNMWMRGHIEESLVPSCPRCCSCNIMRMWPQTASVVTDCLSQIMLSCIHATLMITIWRGANTNMCAQHNFLCWSHICLVNSCKGT